VTDLATHAESVASVKVPGAAERNALEGPDALSGCRDAKSSTMKIITPCKTSPCRPPADCLTRPNPEPPQNDDTKIFLTNPEKVSSIIQSPGGRAAWNVHLLYFFTLASMDMILFCCESITNPTPPQLHTAKTPC